MSPNSNSGFTRSNIPAKGSNLKSHLSAIAIAAALATGNAYAETDKQNADTTPVDGYSPQVVKQVETTKQGFETTLVAASSTGFEAPGAVPAMSNRDFLKYNLNFSTNKSATFVLGKTEEFGDALSSMKKIKGVRIAKGNVEYTPSTTLAEYFKGSTAVYRGSLAEIFKGNTLLLEHFQWYLNSRLGVQDTSVSGVADEATAQKVASVLKNENITAVFTSVLSSFGPEGVRMIQVGGKSVIVYTNLEGLGDNQSVAVLDLPTYDAEGHLDLVNDYNNRFSNIPLQSLKNFTVVPGLDENTARSTVREWIGAVKSETQNISYRSPGTPDKVVTEKEKEVKKSPQASEKGFGRRAPTIIAGNGSILSGNLQSQSALGVLLQPNKLSASHRDEISPDQTSVKAELGFIMEASNQGNNSRVAAELIVLYGMARNGVSLYLEKGSSMEKFALAMGHKLDNGDVIKWDIGTYKQYLEYRFPEIGATRRLAPRQIGTSVSYTHKDLDREAIVKELTGTIRAFHLESLNVGQLGEISRNFNHLFEMFTVAGGIQGGNRVEAEVNTAVDVMQLVKQGFSDTQVRLDIAPNVGYTRYDELLGNRGFGEASAGLRTKLTVLFPDQTLKGSLFLDVRTGNMYTVGAEIAKKFSLGEGAIFAGLTSYGNDQKAVKTIGGKFTIDNPIGLQDEEEVSETLKFPPLFADSRSSKYLTYEDMGRDRGLTDGYKIKPIAVIQKTRTIAIDDTLLPAGSSIDALTGNITLTLPNAATTIVSATRNGAASNTSWFSASGTSFTIFTRQIPVPAIGATDTYVITTDGAPANVITMQVEHGSFKLKSLVVTSAGAVVPAAPSVTADDTANTVTGWNGATMEAALSTDGGATYGAYSSTLPADLSGNKMLKVRVKAAGINPASADTVLSFTTNPVTPSAPSVTADDTANTVTGWNGATMEAALSTDGGATYGAYSSTLPADLSGNKMLKVRVKAAGINPASADTVLSFTTNPDIVAPSTPSTLTLTGNAQASAGYTNTQNISLAVADVTDVSGVSWFVSESSSAPAAGDGGWSGTKPTNFTLSAGAGVKNVYVYVKDNAAPTNNVQAVGKTTSITYDPDVPTITSLPNWGTGADSGATVVGKSVTFADAAGGSPKAISITASAGSIANFSGAYGARTFDFVAPVNNSAGPISVTITYSVTDNAGNVTTTTQNVTVAAAVPDAPSGLNIAGGTLSWNAVPGAVSYNVENITISGVVYTGAATNFNYVLEWSSLPGDVLSVTATNAFGITSSAATIVVP